MKHFLRIIFGGLISAGLLQDCTAQQVPVFSTVYYSKFLSNPAFAGIDNEYKAFGYFRKQWTEFPGSPMTGGATAEVSLSKDRIGLGALVFNDQYGFFNRTNAALAYNQKITFAKHHQISIGIQGALIALSIDWDKARAKDVTDPNLAGQQSQRFTFDGSVGISYKWKRLLVGFSIPQVIESSAKYATAGNTTLDYSLTRHYSLFAQYEIGLLKNQFNITPNFLMRYNGKQLPQFDALVMFDYKKIVYAGLGYRNSFGVLATCGVKVMKMFTIAYAYDHAMSKRYANQVGGSHEIVFGFGIPTDFKRKKREQELLQAQEINTVKEGAEIEKKKLKTKVTVLQKQVDSLTKAKVEEKPANLTNAANSSGTLEDFSKTNNGEKVSYVLDRIEFEYKDYRLKEVSFAQLNQLVKYMIANPEKRIKINGHTDNIGSNNFNVKLSMKRAKAVADYLEVNGIYKSRISSSDYGKNSPVSENETEEGRSKNRRVDFEFLE